MPDGDGRPNRAGTLFAGNYADRATESIVTLVARRVGRCLRRAMIMYNESLIRRGHFPWPAAVAGMWQGPLRTGNFLRAAVYWLGMPAGEMGRSRFAKRPGGRLCSTDERIVPGFSFDGNTP
jgi:hypothetical protein